MITTTDDISLENLVLLVKAIPDSEEPAFQVSWLYGMTPSMKTLVLKALIETIDEEPVLDS